MIVCGASEGDTSWSLRPSSHPTQTVRVNAALGSDSRQFQLPFDTSYEQLQVKLVQLFHEARFSIQWRDEDEDDVSITNTVELRSAIQEEMASKPGVLRLIVRCKEAQFPPVFQVGAPLTLALQTRAAQGAAPSLATEEWVAAATGVIVCDMWNLHPYLNATRREVELCPTMDRLLTALRSRGATVIHAPSGCMGKYEHMPARQRAKAARAVAKPPHGIDEWQHNSAREPLGIGSGPRHAQGPGADAAGAANGYPVDQRDGGNDTHPAEQAAWDETLRAAGAMTHQTAALTIDHDVDYISDIGSEVWNILESRCIANVLLLGVHTNMCVLGRPFGLRQLSALGKNVALVRDMTDSMYNPALPPFVSHYEANRRVFDYIETFVCPTTTSDCILGGKPFRFMSDTDVGAG